MSSLGTPSLPGPTQFFGPRSVERPADGGYTLVGCLDSLEQPKLDAGGALQAGGAGWVLDWWIGGDDRWYVPSKEVALRQRRMGAGPVIETSVRIPSGDAIHRTFGISTPDGEFTVVEIENDSPVPVALAIAIRPYDLTGAPCSLTVALNETTLSVNGAPAVLLPKAPNEFQADTNDLAETVTKGRVLSGDTSATGPGANAVALFPLTHKTTLRFLIPAAGTTGTPFVPEAAAVTRGWDAIIGAGGKVELPDPGLAHQGDAARARLLGGTGELAERVADLQPGAGRHLHALALSGASRDVALSMATLAPRFPPKLRTPPAAAAAVIAAIGRAAMLVNDQVLLEAVLDPVAHITTLVERSKDGDATMLALSGLARLADAVGQHDAAADLWTRVGEESYPGVPTGIDGLATLAESSSSADSWGPDEVDPAARYWIGLRGLLVKERHDIVDANTGRRTIDLLPTFASSWRGANFETLGLQTDYGRLSFAVRWHGYRPALLWDFDGPESVTLKCPGLDASWSTTDPKGETLLTGSEQELPDAPTAGSSFQ